MNREMLCILLVVAGSFSSAYGQAVLGGNCSEYDLNCLINPYGAGSPYKTDGFNNPYSENGSSYSDTSLNNPYATNAPKLYDEDGNYHGRLSNNPYDLNSTSNPYGQYGNPRSSDSINNPNGIGKRNNKIYVVPQK